MSLQKMAVFIDTNVVLHYRFLSEIDWCSLLQANTVEIKIAPVVTRELEEHKTLHKSRKLSARAATGLKLLHKYLTQNQVRKNVTLEFLNKEPNAEYAASHGLNLQLGDDWLIGTLLLCRDSNPDLRCVLVTSDLSLKVKANHAQIEFVELPEILQLPSELDPSEKKIRQLETELNRHKSREPVLDVRFKTGEDYARFRILTPKDASDLETEIQAKVAAAKQKCPLVVLNPAHDKDDSVIAPNPLIESILQIAKPFQEVRRRLDEDYNLRARAYHQDYEQYLRTTIAFEALSKRTIRLNLNVENSGTCPAEDIHVLLHFPDGFTLYDEEHTPEKPEAPTAPSKEMDLSPNTSPLSSMSFLPNIRAYRPEPPPDPSLPRIRKTNSYELTIENDKLQHGFIWTFTRLYIAFDSWESVNSFSIDYVIHAGNMIDVRSGELNVIIDKV